MATKEIEIQEQMIAESVQTPLINRFLISASLSVLHIVFFETAQIPYARAACCMSVEDAEELYKTLGIAIEQMKPAGKKHYRLLLRL